MAGFVPSGRLSAPVQGALWMIGAAASLTIMAVLIRVLSPGYSVLELILLRNIVNLALMGPWIASKGVAAAKTKRLGLHALRNAFQYTGNVAWFYAVTMIALADMSALQFITPLFTVVLAALFLGERIGIHRWVATAIGFGGALVIIQPGFADVGLGTILAVVAAFLYSGSYTTTKKLSSTESGHVVVFYMSVFLVLFAAIPAAFVWTTPSWEDAPAIVGLGITGYTTHYCVTRSMAAADASFVAPFDFLRLPFSAVLGALLFMESTSIWTWVGAVVIFGAAYYNTWQEKQAGQEKQAAREKPSGQEKQTDGRPRR